MKKSIIAVGAVLLAAATATAVIFLPSGHDDQSAHNAHTNSIMTSGSMPSEGGQGAFAALSEFVALLSADADTDWSKVDIDGLRKHLVDMNEVTLNAMVESRQVGNDLNFTITGPPRTAEAIKRMVPAHTAVMNAENSGRFETNEIDNGVVLNLRELSDEQRKRFAALGFFGFMATGAHHQPHHLAMANGEPLHTH